jgi:acetoacetate decarboxylase
MKIDAARETAFAMPLTNPAYPRGPYRFYDREFIVITYRTDQPEGQNRRLGSVFEHLAKMPTLNMP